MQEVSVEAPDRVHVKHIYPLKPGHPWENHAEAVHRLGNLTLLAKLLNQTIRNSEFDAKKPYYEKSDLLITKELVAYDAWNIEAINKRQEDMSKLALKIWTFPPENEPHVG